MKKIIQTRGTLLEALEAMMGASSATSLRKLIGNRRVLVDGSVQTRGDIALMPGQTIEISPRETQRKPLRKPPPRTTIRPERGSHRTPHIPILLEDEYLIAVDKPPGLLSIATDNETRKTLYRRVMEHVQETSDGLRRAFIVHRLDRDASGVILFAKDEATKRKLQDNWAGATKLYHAVVEGRPPQDEGTVRNYLCENRAMRVYVCGQDAEGAQEAVTHYRVLRGKEGGRHLLEVRIETGRKHQIRVHMALVLKCPIVGDDVYGLGKEVSRGIALHSHSLAFDHPVTGKRVTVESAMPSRFRSLV